MYCSFKCQTEELVLAVKDDGERLFCLRHIRPPFLMVFQGFVSVPGPGYGQCVTNMSQTNSVFTVQTLCHWGAKLRHELRKIQHLHVVRLSRKARSSASAPFQCYLTCSLSVAPLFEYRSDLK